MPSRSPSSDDPFGLSLRWIMRRLIRLAFDRYFGSPFVLLVGLLLAIGGLALLDSPLGGTLGEFGFYLLLGAFLCLGLLTGMLRRYLRKPRAEWPKLGMFGRIGRLSLVLVGTVVFFAPFAWVAWLIVGR
jgi:hypothetical protein